LRPGRSGVDSGVVAQCGLDREAGVDGIERRRERGERLVSRRLDPLAAVAFDQGTHDGAMPLPDLEPALLALRHQGRVAHDVGEHDRG
jgi:hypothetical protein